MNDTILNIENILKEKLENKFFEIKEYNNNQSLMIDIAKNNLEINWVKRQYPEHISLRLQDNKLEYFSFWGCGGRFIYRNIDPTNPKEKFNSLWHEKMPAIRNKDILKAITKVCDDYIKITNEIKEKWLDRNF